MALDDSYTVSLLHMNGSDASTTFIDENSAISWAASGNAQIDTAQSVFGGASGVFDGTGDYISTTDRVDIWRLDNGSNSNKWTVDFRVRFNGDPGTGVAGFLQMRVDNNNYWSIDINNNTLRLLVRDGGGNIILISNSWNPATATWYHVAVVKDGTNGYMMFIDGTQIGTTSTAFSTVIPSLNGTVYIARFIATDGTSYYLNGWIDEMRVSRGVARWTADFTPPTAEYSAISNFFF